MKKNLLFLITAFLFSVTSFSQTVTTFAGSGATGSTDATGTAASFYVPSDVAVDAAGNLYVADAFNNKIRKITPAGVVTTLAGSGTQGSTDGNGTTASFKSPRGVAVDASGNVYVADQENDKIRKITASGVVTTFAGSSTFGSTDGIGTAASFNYPYGLAVDGSGNIYVADTYNHKIRKITPAGVVSTFAGSGTSGSADGTGTAASFSLPHAVVVDISGNVYVADTDNNKIRKITSAGVVTTLAGSGTSGSADGISTAASFNNPRGLTVDSSGNVYVSDSFSNKIRKITAAGVVTTFAGSGSSGSLDGTGTAASLALPYGIDFDGSGNLYVADSGNSKIRKITSLPATHLNFDGTNDYVTAGNILPSSYTKEAMIFLTANSSSNNIISGSNSAGQHAFWVPNMILSAGHNGTWGAVQDAVNLALNTWYHVAVSYDSATQTLKLYKNGVLISTATNISAPINGNQVLIGAYDNGNLFNGNIDEVRIWNTVRTAEQINGSANCELQGNEAGLLAYYKFNQGLDAADNTSITSLSDATANANNGTLVNFALNGSTSNFLAGSPVTTGVIVPAVTTVTTPVTYNQGDTATALTATVGANGTSLVWYTAASGGTALTTAPTPSTVNPGNTSYWVASTNANGCESARTEIVVQVNASTTAGCWAKIASGEDHTVAIAQNGTLWAWGNNYFSQLGDGTTTNRNTPTQLGTATTWQSISCGFRLTVAIKTDGTLWAWGNNGFGQLGDGTTTNRNTPTQIGNASTWQSISCGYFHTVAIKTDGTLWAWGDNNYGQLGDGTTTNSNTPTPIGTATTWQSIAGGIFQTVAIKTDGTLWAWGNNTGGQLGDGTTIDRNTPTQIGIATTWQSISGGRFHTVAIKTDGTLWAWGDNSYGQLGDGTNTYKNTPTQIGAGTTWQRISVGYYHTVAIKTDGTLWAWGLNSSGQLGDGTNTNKNTPTQIGIGTTWQKISSGYFNTVAIKTNGSLWAWGYNIYGQLGLGDTTNRNTPTEVDCPSVLGTEDFISQTKVTIYPNPSNGIFNIVSQEDITIEVYDMIGKKVITKNATIGASNLDLSNYANGIYLLTVTNQKGSLNTYKLVKQ